MRRAACFFVVRAEYHGLLHAAGDNAPARPAGGRIGQSAPIKFALQNPAGAGIIVMIAQYSAPEK